MNAALSGFAVLVAVLLLLVPNRAGDLWENLLIAFWLGLAVWSALDLLESTRASIRKMHR